MIKMFVYHFFLTCEDGFERLSIDGIARLRNKIVDREGYTQLKEVITENHCDNPKGMVIKSLSFLYEDWESVEEDIDE